MVFKLLPAATFLQKAGDNQAHRREKPKVAQYRSRTVALLHLNIHVIPLAVSLLILVLNLRVTFIGHLDSGVVTALQFAAKLQETLIQASIATIVVSVVRAQALGPRPFSFGGLLAPHRLNDVSYLWSLDLWGSITSSSTKGWRIPALIILCIASTILTVLVGPSSAVLMIPRQMSHAGNRSLFMLNSSNILFPTNVTGNTRIPSKFVNLDPTFRQQIFHLQRNTNFKFTTPVVDSSGVRNLQFAMSNSPQAPNAFTVRATIPTRMTADILNHVHYGTISARSLQPVMIMDCWEQKHKQLPTNKTRFVDFGPNKPYLDHTVSLANTLQNYTFAKNSSVHGSFLVEPPHGNEGYQTQVYVLRIPQSVHNHSALIMTEVQNSDDSVISTACTISAYWTRVKSTIVNGESINSIDVGKINDMNKTEPIKLSMTWLGSVVSAWAVAQGGPGGYYTKFPTQTTATAILLYLAATPPTVKRGKENSLGPNFDLYGQFSTPSTSSTHLTAQQNSDLLNFLSSNKLYDRYSEIRLYKNVTNWTDPASLAQVEVQPSYYGYAYDISTIPSVLSLVVIVAYASMSFVYIVYTLLTGNTATSWESVAELVSLALHSTAPEALQGTSAGIATAETYRQPINIRVNDQDSLEIVFIEDKKNDVSKYRNVELNEKY